MKDLCKGANSRTSKTCDCPVQSIHSSSGHNISPYHNSLPPPPCSTPWPPPSHSPPGHSTAPVHSTHHPGHNSQLVTGLTGHTWTDHSRL